MFGGGRVSSDIPLGMFCWGVGVVRCKKGLVGEVTKDVGLL